MPPKPLVALLAFLVLFLVYPSLLCAQSPGAIMSGGALEYFSTAAGGPVLPGSPMLYRLQVPARFNSPQTPVRVSARLAGVKERILEGRSAYLGLRKGMDCHVLYFPLPPDCPEGRGIITVTLEPAHPSGFDAGAWVPRQKTIMLQQEFMVTPRNWVRETIPLNSAMNSIRDNRTRLKEEQARRYQGVLAGRNEASVFIDVPSGGLDTAVFGPAVENMRRTAFFGDRRTYAYPDGRREYGTHWGVDYGIPAGTPVMAPARGRVVLAENRIVTGWTVIIEHLPGMFSIYMHMDNLLVREGQVVFPGLFLGHSGMTGFATGPHLHQELRMDTLAVDPELLLQH